MNPLDLPDSRFLLLLVIACGERLGTADGVLTLSMPNTDEAAPIPSLPGSLDDLEERGWIQVTGGAAAITERGTYWLNKWLARKTKVRGVLRGMHLRAVRI